MKIYYPDGQETNTKNVYKNQLSEDKKPPITQFKDKLCGYWNNLNEKTKTTISAGLGVAAIAGVIALGAYSQQNNQDIKDINLKGNPSNYELKSHNLPRNDVTHITLGKDTLNMNITRNPEEGTITYEGPINYKTKSSTSPIPHDAKLVQEMRNRTDHGSVTLENKLLDNYK